MGPIARILTKYGLLVTGLLFGSGSVAAQSMPHSFSESTFMLSDTSLYAWGNNYSSQLGLDITVHGSTVDEPTLVSSPAGGYGWRQIAAGISHTLGITNSGKLYGAGYPGNGRLGNAAGGTFQPIIVPSGANSWKMVACGYNFSMALTKDGKLWAFGQNEGGMLGLGDMIDRTTPTEVPMPAGVTSWTAVWAGGVHTIAKANDGKLYGWGNNVYSQVAHTDSSQHLSPAAISAPAQMGDVTWISAGRLSTCAITADGEMYVWGDNSYGQLGVGVTGTIVTKPTKVSLPAGASGFLQVSSGYYHVVVTTLEHAVYTMGQNWSGQIGDGTNDNRASLTQVFRTGGTALIGSGWAAADATFLLDTTGTLWAWGSNAAKQIGDTNAVGVNRPRKIKNSIGGGGGGYAPADTTCLYSEDAIFLDDPNGTQVFAAGADDTTSSLQNIGFTFRFKGVDYTTFSVSSNGLVGLGSVPVSSSPANALATLTTPTLAAFWDDLVLGTYPVLIQNSGQGNAHSLHITWRGRIKTADPNVQASITVHALLIEATQSVSYWYSYGGSVPTSASIGWSVGGRWVSFSPGSPWTQNNLVANNTVNLGSGVPYTSALVIDDSCTPPPPPPPTGVTYTRLQLGVIIDLSNVWFVSDLEGFVVGTGGRLFRTIDGGLTWVVVVTGTTVDLTGFRIINGRWYVYGKNGVVRYSLNGGVTWVTIQLDVNVTITDIRFISDNYGIAVGHGGVVFIWNGTTWLRQTLNVSINVNFTAVYVYGAYVYVVGTGGNLWRYDGTSWIRITLNLNIDITSLTMLDGMFGYLVGTDGTLCRTFDGGLTWSVLVSGVNVRLRSVCIISRNIAYVVGDGGVLLQTLDGGVTWVRIDLNTSVSLFSVTFINGWGYIVGAGGTIFRFHSDYVFTSFGTTFSRVFTNVTTRLENMVFLDLYRGLMIGEGGIVLRTIDGGITWVSINLDINIHITNIRFINGVVYVCGSNGYLAYSIDGGVTWIRINLNVTVRFTTLIFVNASYGFLVGEGGVIFRFNGTSWVREAISTVRSFRSITVVGSNVWAIGDSGTIFRYDGRSWVLVNLGITVNLLQITFVDHRLGWIIGEGGFAWRTIDGGRTWTQITIDVGIDVEFRSIRFASRWVGWIACAHGVVLQTIDGGGSWTKIDFGVDIDLLWAYYFRGVGYVGGSDGRCWSFTSDHLRYAEGIHISRLDLGVIADLHHCQFYDSFLGVVVGNDGVLRITTTGGLSWIQRGLTLSVRLRGATFVDSVLFVVGDNGTICRSLDLGITWFRFPINTSDHFYSIAMLNRNDGFAVGQYGAIWRYNGSRWTKMTVQTTQTFTRVFMSGHVCFAVGKFGVIYQWDGATWRQVIGLGSQDLCDISFSDAQFGLIVGDGGCVLRTIDGGRTWVRVNIGLTVRINALHIVSRELIFAVCNGGVLLRSTNGGTSWVQIHIATEDLVGITFNAGYGWIVGLSGRAYGFTYDLIDARMYRFSTIRKGLNFDGENTFVDLGRKSSFGVDKSLSLMAWIYPTAFGEFSGIIGNRRLIGADSRGYGLILNRFGQVGMVITRSNGVAQWVWSDSTVKLNRWSHVSGVFDGTSMQIYIDGVVRGRISFATMQMLPTDDKMTIGWYQGYYRSFFNGSIDDVSIWGTACPQSHVRRSMHDRLVGIEPWLIGAWHVGEGGGRSVMDVTTGHEDMVVAGNSVERTPLVSVGRSWHGIVDRVGNFYVDGTDSRFDIRTITKSTEVTVHSLVDVESISAPPRSGRIFPRMWIVQTHVPTAFTGTWQLILGPTAMSPRDVTDPSRWVLYRRQLPYTGNWTLVSTSTAIDAKTGTLTFPLLDWDGQYIVGCTGDSPLDVRLDAAVVVQPVDITVCEDNTAELSVLASGTNLRYQWRRGGKAIVGANDRTYRISSTQQADRASYDVVIDAQTTSGATSLLGHLDLSLAPTIASQPRDRRICEGGMLDLGIVASGTNITYQWIHNGKKLTGADTYRFIVTSSTATDSGWYKVQVGGACQPWVVTDSVYVGIDLRPFVQKHPRDTSVTVGASVHLFVGALHDVTSYQWRKNGVNLIGQTEPGFDIDSAVLADTGMYDVIVNGPCGSDTSMVAQVNVRNVVSHVFAEDEEQGTARIYPQPAATSVTIDLTDMNISSLKGATCLLIDVNGQLVMDLTSEITASSGSVFTIDVQSITSGIYSCVIRSEEVTRFVGSVSVLR